MGGWIASEKHRVIQRISCIGDRFGEHNEESDVVVSAVSRSDDRAGIVIDDDAYFKGSIDIVRKESDKADKATNGANG